MIKVLQIFIFLSFLTYATEKSHAKELKEMSFLNQDNQPTDLSASWLWGCSASPESERLSSDRTTAIGQRSVLSHFILNAKPSYFAR